MNRVVTSSVASNAGVLELEVSKEREPATEKGSLFSMRQGAVSPPGTPADSVPRTLKTPIQPAGLFRFLLSFRQPSVSTRGGLGRRWVGLLWVQDGQERDGRAAG